MDGCGQDSGRSEDESSSLVDSRKPVGASRLSATLVAPSRTLINHTRIEVAYVNRRNASVITQWRPLDTDNALPQRAVAKE